MEALSIQSKIVLNNGDAIPAIGLGVFRSEEGSEVENAVMWALEEGYRMVDTAQVYGNEEGVGRAIKKSGVRREDVFITTKLWNESQGYESALLAMNDSLRRLDMEFVDLYLIHWPSASADRFETINKRQETWKAMEEIVASGKAKAIGVSNFTIRHLEEMKGYTTIAPTVNQVEFHPFLYQADLLEYCNQNSIALEAYSPLVKGRKMDNETIGNVAEKYGKSKAQILIRWSLQHGCVVIPKSVTKSRIKENISVFDFQLSDDDMNALDALHEDIHQAWDPGQIA